MSARGRLQRVSASRLLPTLAALASLATPAAAQTLDDVVVSANRNEQRSFDAPAAIQSVDRETIQSAGPQVNLSESLNRVPGITVLNRQNFAQDLQLSIRGFGARTGFGIRGVRLIVDGIPATMPDGQGQASTISLTSTERIEVLRGPLAQMYGNAAGGVVQAFTREAPETPELLLQGYTGSYGLDRGALQFAGRSGAYGLVADYGAFNTDGFRDNSRTVRRHFNGRLTWGDGRTRFAVTANLFDMPLAQDPGGLGEDWASNPRSVQPNFEANRARKTVRQNQLGLLASHLFDNDLELQARVYAGTREVFQAQSLATWIGTDRQYNGVGLQLTRAFRIGALPGRWTVGTDWDRSGEDRTGGTTGQGGAAPGDKTPGSLTRNQDYTADNRDAYAQFDVSLTESVSLIAGVRSSRVGLDVDDRVTPALSGSVGYRATNPVLGVSWHLSESTNLYANVGKGFETPTIAETTYTGTALADRFNDGLRPARSTHRELGVKWQLDATTRVDAAVYSADTEDEIVVLASRGGKTSYTNAARTERKGIELSARSVFARRWRGLLSFNRIVAEYADGFQSGAIAVPAGSRLPGVPQQYLFGELAWTSEPYDPGRVRGAGRGWELGLEWINAGRLYANDLNTRSADGYDVYNLRASYTFPMNDAHLTFVVRLDNLSNENYVGSVIVGNANPYEPAPGRNWLAGVRLIVPL
jgi:iron complex outermembrane recepter protein